MAQYGKMYKTREQNTQIFGKKIWIQFWQLIWHWTYKCIWHHWNRKSEENCIEEIYVVVIKIYIEYSCTVTNVSEASFNDTHLINSINTYNSNGKKIAKAKSLNFLWYFNK